MKEFSSILTTDSSAFRARVCLFFFLCKVVSCCITVSSVKGYRLLSYVYPQRKYYTPYGKIFFQKLWGINCSFGLVKKKEEKKRKYNGLKGKTKNPKSA